MSYTRYGTPSVSKAEFEFNKLFKEQTKEALFPDDDWLHKRTNTLFEIKDIDYPMTHFRDGVIRMNQVSLDGHYAKRGRYRKVYVIAMFTDCNMYADIESVMKDIKNDTLNIFGDRPTYMVALSAFKPIVNISELLK